VPGDTITVDYRETGQGNGNGSKEFVFDVTDHKEVAKTDEVTDELVALLQ
jgi:hypothetical protein